LVGRLSLPDRNAPTLAVLHPAGPVSTPPGFVSAGTLPNSPITPRVSHSEKGIGSPVFGKSTPPPFGAPAQNQLLGVQPRR
jgi:hypothetical protein